MSPSKRSTLPQSSPPLNARSFHRDIIVVGASAGGVEALRVLVAGLPEDFPAAILVVLHFPAESPSLLPQILTRAGKIPAHHARHGEPVRHGHIYVAPPDYHLTVAKGKVALWHGPKENGHRPAVDPLFRTAARNYGARVVGVVLTGTFDCGTAGLLAIKARDGLAIVQDPDDSLMPDMPKNAIEHVKVDDIVPIAGMAERLVKWIHEPAKGASVMTPKSSVPSGTISEVVCPACQGSLTEIEVHGLLQFRCHVGHVFSLQSLAAEQANALESALWAGVRALEETAALAERMAGRSVPPLRSRYEDKGRAMRRQADVIRHMLLHEELLAEPDASLPRPPTPGARPMLKRAK